MMKIAVTNICGMLQDVTNKKQELSKQDQTNYKVYDTPVCYKCLVLIRYKKSPNFDDHQDSHKPVDWLREKQVTFCLVGKKCRSDTIIFMYVWIE